MTELIGDLMSPKIDQMIAKTLSAGMGRFTVDQFEKEIISLMAFARRDERKICAKTGCMYCHERLKREQEELEDTKDDG